MTCGVDAIVSSPISAVGSIRRRRRCHARQRSGSARFEFAFERKTDLGLRRADDQVAPKAAVGGFPEWGLCGGHLGARRCPTHIIYETSLLSAFWRGFATALW